LRSWSDIAVPEEELEPPRRQDAKEEKTRQEEEKKSKYQEMAIRLLLGFSSLVFSSLASWRLGG
jgi:hypothetical protein